MRIAQINSAVDNINIFNFNGLDSYTYYYLYVLR